MVTSGHSWQHLGPAGHIGHQLAKISHIILTITAHSRRAAACPASAAAECEFCKKPLLFNRLEARVRPCRLENCPVAAAVSPVATAVAA